MPRALKELFQRQTLIAVVLVSLVSLGGYAIFKSEARLEPDFNNLPLNIEPGEEYVLTMTDEGFSPREITIYVGQVIVFKTEKTKPFWPASNFHPSHSIFAELDPKRPITTDESWSFTFNKIGEYRFHDHLFPSAQGVIYVVSPNRLFEEREYLDCDDQKNRSTSQCWDFLIQEGWQ